MYLILFDDTEEHILVIEDLFDCAPVNRTAVPQLLIFEVGWFSHLK